MERKVNVIEGIDGKKLEEIYHRIIQVQLVRHASDGKKYLYDLMQIKKETGNCCRE